MKKARKTGIVADKTITRCIEEFPTVFILDDYFTTFEIKAIIKKTPKLNFIQKSWFTHDEFHINISDKCPCCRSKDIRRIPYGLLDNFLEDSPWDQIEFSYIKLCPICHWTHFSRIFATGWDG